MFSPVGRFLRHDETTPSMSTARSQTISLRSRPFCITVLTLSLLAAYSIFLRRDAPTSSLFRRSHDAEPQCNQVHMVADQCAFVKLYCADADAGLLPYLQFYYCTLGRARPLAFILLVAWLGLLFTTIGIAASDFFSVNVSTITAILGLSQSLAGVTFLAFGNGSPDVFSTFAAMSSNSPSMAVGELIGAASFIIGVVAGSMALAREFRVDTRSYTRDIGFFIVAVGFTMVFLADGKLHFWECWAMIAYYILYVITVVGYHWLEVRRKQRLRREGEFRSHFYSLPGHSGDELAGEPFRDDPDDVDRGPGQPVSPTSSAHGVAVSVAGLSRLDIETQTALDESADHVDDRDRKLAAEVTRNMRIVRSALKRQPTVNAIRPSLVGALEFRSALAQLQRESNLRLSYMLSRSYSENHVRKRTQAESEGIVPNVELHTSTADTSEGAAQSRDRAMLSGDLPVSSKNMPDSACDGHDRNTSRIPLSGVALNNHRPRAPAFPQLVTGHTEAECDIDCDSLPRSQLPMAGPSGSRSGLSSPCAPFPRYTESPCPATPVALSDHRRRDNYFPRLQVAATASNRSHIAWWPYSVLPPPHVLFASLFPTLQGWKEKSHWDRFLSTISLPSIFLLIITLPVVDAETNDDASSLDGDSVDDLSQRAVDHGPSAISVLAMGGQPEIVWERQGSSTLTGGDDQGQIVNDGSDSAAAEQAGRRVDDRTTSWTLGSSLAALRALSDLPSASQATEPPPSWNRWLKCVQLFTGPFFAAVVLWANLRDDMEQPGRELVRILLYTLTVVLVLLVLLLLTTTEHTPPRFHYLFCFLGFVISISWISTIAGEVVGVLKAFGIILGISEALLGLTIFAAGNSIGDLVANITVARLGYPVMALSACFGGPMLNILLGIGIGGVSMMIRRAQQKHAQQPDQPVRYGPYRVEVGGMLLISSITLLLMLVLLVLVVPLSKWILSRKIGWGLIALWTISTALNVVVDVTRAWGEPS